MNTAINATLRGTQAAALQTMGQGLRELRQNAVLTQQQLAEQNSVTEQAISEWERSNNGPNPQTRQALANLCGLSPHELDDRLGHTSARYAQPGYRPDQLDPHRLLQARQDLNLALKEAAKRSRVNSRTIRASERGVSVPATETLIKLAKAYDKPLSWFMSDDHSTQSHEPKGHGNEATAWQANTYT